jgi:molybdopterin biosynthesis enzyme MoaB
LIVFQWYIKFFTNLRLKISHIIISSQFSGHSNERKWKPRVDWLKCQITNITSKRNIISHKYNIHGHTLEVVDSANYLGLNIHKSLKWNDHLR